MMYSLELLPSARANLSRLDPPVAQRVMAGLLWNKTYAFENVQSSFP